MRERVRDAAVVESEIHNVTNTTHLFIYFLLVLNKQYGFGLVNVLSLHMYYDIFLNTQI